MDFKNIPKKYRPIPFWSWNEKLEVNETKRQIDEMEAKGIGGFFMHARGGLQTKYMGDEWFENIDACLEKCRENGMLPWAYDENGWPSGFGNGLVNGLGVEYQQKYLRITDKNYESDHKICEFENYTLYYDINPFYVDTLDKKVTECFIDKIYKPYYERYKDGFEGFFTDEPQISRDGIPWSFIMPEEYKKRYDADIFEVLHQLFLEVGDYKTTRIKFWKMVTDLFSNKFFKPIYDWCTSHNLKFTGHLVLEETPEIQITSNGACMPHYEYFTIPGIDWLGRHTSPCLTTYQLSSAASQLGKKQVLSETFALCGHNVGHDELKLIYEHQMVRGINLLCQHLEGYSNRGIRKRDFPPAMYIQQPWWEEYKTFNDAMSRIGMMIAESKENTDVLLLHPQTAAWTMYNDDNRCLERHKNQCGTKALNDLYDKILDTIKVLEEKHIEFHFGDETLIERHGKVENDRFIIGEKSYSRIIVLDNENILENTEKLLKMYVENGGIITSAEELPYNNVIDSKEITYCCRVLDDCTMHYFVNGTENEIDTNINVGNKVMDISTGELEDFHGKHTFKKYESLVIIDDYSPRSDESPEKHFETVDLNGEWNVDSTSENVLTLDYCDYYFDGVLQEKYGYVLNAMHRALELKRKVNIICKYHFKAEYTPDKLYLVSETPEKFKISVNGKEVDKTDCGYFRDKSFRKIDITEYIKKGVNEISMEIDFSQSDQVYENIEKSKIFESEKNKLTFDTEIEQIYLIGDFSVETPGEFEPLEKNVSRYSGDFIIKAPTKKVTLQNIEKQGFPFFAGEITLSKTVNTTASNLMLKFEKRGVNAIKAHVNDEYAGKLMWTPFELNISPFIKKGENKISLTLVNNLRNMQGPLHMQAGEWYFVSPKDFYKEACVWNPGAKEEEWNDNYCLAEISIL